MKQYLKKITAGLLAIFMVCSIFFESLSVLAGSALAVTDQEKFYRLQAGTGNGNDHFGGAAPEAFVLTDRADYGKVNFNYSIRLAADSNVTRLRLVTKYVNQHTWTYIGYDKGNWYIQYQNGTNSSWPNISGLPAMAKDDLVTVSGTWGQTGLVLEVVNTTSGQQGSTTINQADFLSINEMVGQIGFGAARYSSEITAFDFGALEFGGAAYTAGFTWHRDGLAGQSLTMLPGEQDPDDSDVPVVTGDGRKWITVRPGANNGSGHAYGDPNAKGPIFLANNRRTMPKGGELSLLHTTLANTPNFGIFYTYQDDSNWLYVGWDNSSKWYYQYKLGGRENYPKLSNLPDPVNGEPMAITISLSNETLSVTVNGATVRMPNQDLMTLANQINGTGKFGVMTKGTNTPVEFADFTLDGQDCMNDSWKFLAARNGQAAEARIEQVYQVSGRVVDQNNQPIANANVRLGVNAAKTDANGAYTFTKISDGNYSLSASGSGYQANSRDILVNGADLSNITIMLLPRGVIDLNNYDSISSGEMKAYIGKSFPLVAQYEVGTGRDIFLGQLESLNKVSINGKAITPVVTPQAGFTQGAASKTYSLALQDAGSGINLVMEVKISIRDKNLTWEVTRIEKGSGCPAIATIEIPNLNLVTIEDTEENAGFAGASASTTTTVSGDSFISFNSGFAPNTTNSYLYGFLTNENLSAGLWSNSEVEGDKRVTLNKGSDTMSLTSSVWYYERGDRNAQTKNYTYPVKSELPCVKVSLAGDLNEDGQIDWNDGALGFRSIMNYPQGSEQVKEMVNHRIAMNFASMAPNPYLETADNIKKLYLATDGLSQSVILKGYGNEGHDSANSEYADIGERLGGVDDFKDLIKIAHKYNTKIGIHVNAQEIYPEAASFNETMAKENGSVFGKGWGWLDQSFTINKLWDLSSQARWKRFVQLYDRINGTNFYSRQWPLAVGESQGTAAGLAALKADAANRPDNMDLIYLDVWYQDSWETRRIAEEINSLGWRFTTEFSGQGEYDSTWQHWSTDATYGGYTAKGFNSDIIRFLRNDHRDSQVLNYPSFGGAADNPLLGGYRLHGFEGWVSATQDYNAYLFGTFNENLPTRFLQHYYVTKWENYGRNESSPTGNKEKRITLKNDAGDQVVVTRNTAQRSDSNIERKVTLNGKTVLNDVTYLLPWTDVETDEEKLYHWNMDGGTTTWELQNGWSNLASVKMYELSDLGRTNMQNVPVSNGKVTITAKRATAYVLCKGSSAKTLKDAYGEYNYVVDPGFNAYAGAGESLSASVWSGSITNGAVKVRKAATGDQRLEFNAPATDAAVTTTISGLTGGKNYVAEIYVDNRSDAKASITVATGSKTVSNYTVRSIAQNYIRCDEEHTGSLMTSYMQIMQVSFVAQGPTATLTLKREAGAGTTYMDDIRIVDKTLNNFRADGSFVQDFETVVQGIYPFVLGSAQGVDDPCTHLSQLHAPFTQSGWNNKVLDDVISGNWSLKHHNKNTGILYQTIPQNFRFEPNKVYNVSFKYQSGPNQAYAFVVGNGTSYTTPGTGNYLPSTKGSPATTRVCQFKVTGSGNGQTWIGIYTNASKMSAADQANVLGGFDFILDDLTITEE